MFGPTTRFSGRPIQWNHAKCCGADPCCHGNDIWARHKDPVAYRLLYSVIVHCFFLTLSTNKMYVCLLTIHFLSSARWRMTLHCTPSQASSRWKKKTVNSKQNAVTCRFARWSAVHQKRVDVQVQSASISVSSKFCFFFKTNTSYRRVLHPPKWRFHNVTLRASELAPNWHAICL